MNTKFLLGLQVVAGVLCGYSTVIDLIRGAWLSALVFGALTAYNVWAGVASVKRLRA